MVTTSTITAPNADRAGATAVTKPWVHAPLASVTFDPAEVEMIPPARLYQRILTLQLSAVTAVRNAATAV